MRGRFVIENVFSIFLKTFHDLLTKFDLDISFLQMFPLVRFDTIHYILKMNILYKDYRVGQCGCPIKSTSYQHWKHDA